jgi:glyoxylase-like metal-dependent hydrolase (beta-lactamase superfamily II)
MQPDLNRFGIHRLIIPVPFPVEPLNVYFAAEPVPTLIDTPPRGRSFMKLLGEHLDGFGFSTGDIRRIILTHPHFDHYGLAGDIVASSGAEIWAAEGTGDCFRVGTVEEDERFHEDLLLLAGAPPKWIAYVKNKFGGWARKYGCDLTPVKYLKDGSTVQIGTGNFIIASVPGHTPWCMLFHNPDHNICFTGDFLLHNISSNPIVQRPSLVPKGYGSLKALISSFKKVRKMGLGIALPGHGRLIDDPNERIDALLGFIEQRKALVYHALGSEPQTLMRMVKRIFPRLRRHELFLAVSEVIGHLEVLEEEGRVVREEPTGETPLLFFVAAPR